MNYYQEINSAKNIFISHIFEPKENSLEFELTIGKLSDIEEPIIWNGVDLGIGKSIYYDDKSDKYKVTFDSYICYSVINESFDNLYEKEFTGNKARIYSDSNLLNYIKEDTIATFDYPGEYKHYSLIAEDHIINVVSTIEPAIEKVN